MVDYAPGMRTIIRDEEWMVKKIETNSLGNKALYCVGISPLVKDKDAIFLTDLENIQIVNPAEIKLIPDHSPRYKRSLLNGISFDDLDDGSDLGDRCQSLTHGLKPVVKAFGDAGEELAFILDEIKKLKEAGVALSNICLVARTKKLVDDYIAQITRAGLRAYEIKRSKTEDRSLDGVRVATMHRVKGLEFQYVFITAVNNRVIPLPSAINRTDAISEAETLTSEKCLLYVALTRAQKGAYITSYGKVSSFIA